MAITVTRYRYRCGVSRIEVSVVSAILVLLSALVIPAIRQTRESARQTQCKNSLKQIVLALHNYHDVMETFPQGCIGNSTLPPDKRWSWYLSIGNYLGHYGTPVINYERSWDDPDLRPLQLHTWRNKPFQEFDVPLVPSSVIKCPNGTQQTYSDGQPLADYVGTAGIAPQAALLPCNSNHAGAWAYNECRAFSDMRDGISTTLIAIETGSKNGCWLAGGTATVRDYLAEHPPIGHGREFGGLHHNGGMVAFVDGHVVFLSNETSADVLSSLLTIAGSELASEKADGPR